MKEISKVIDGYLLQEEGKRQLFKQILGKVHKGIRRSEKKLFKKFSLSDHAMMIKAFVGRDGRDWIGEVFEKISQLETDSVKYVETVELKDKED